MPVRSLSSPVLKWPDRDTVLEAVSSWSKEAAEAHPEVEALALYGSYARGDWGVGSDVDLLALVSSSDTLFERRSLAWDLGSLPVPGQLVIYTREEWEGLRERGARIVRTVEDEGIWLRGAPSRAGRLPDDPPTAP